jgi:hypothetical protein
MNEATWILYSFDVKMEGAGACRKTDKMKMNHGNTICMAGNDGPTLKPGEFLKKVMCDCSKAEKAKPKPKGYTCLNDFGNNVDACCQQAIKDHRGAPAMQGEQGYNPNGTKSSVVRKRDAYKTTGEFFKAISGKRFPDAASLDANGKVTQFFDFKAKCPTGMRMHNGKKSGFASGSATPGWTPGRVIKRGPNKGKKRLGQKQKIINLGKQQKPKVTKPPELVTNVGCK